MPRFTHQHRSFATINGIANLVLTADPVASFRLLSVEVTFARGTPTAVIGDEQGLIDIALMTSGGSSPTNFVPRKCDPNANGVNLVTPRYNYALDPTFAAPSYRIACPLRSTQHLFWDDEEFVVPGGSGVGFIHNTGQSMPSNSCYRFTVEWLE